MPLLEVAGVSKYYTAGIAAVDDVSLDLQEGEILCLLGPSGCGKTTLLRLIAGLEAADSGTIRFDDRDLAGVPPHQRDFGMMFQDFALFPHKDVFQNVAFGLRMHRRPPDEIAARVSEMLDLVDLERFTEREIASMSGGEQQRVALARALAPSPKLLMLDEPLGALDRAMRERLMLEVRAILKRIGMTAIYVTHDQTEAFAVGDRLAVMNTGRIEQLGPPRTIYERPATPFVARFLGFQNLIPGRVNGGGEVETTIGRFRPDDPLPRADSPVTLLVKPAIEDVDVSPVGAAAINEINGIVEVVTFRGRFSQVRVASGEHQLLFEVAGDPSFRIGDPIRVIVDPDQLQLYGF